MNLLIYYSLMYIVASCLQVVAGLFSAHDMLTSSCWFVFLLTSSCWFAGYSAKHGDEKLTYAYITCSFICCTELVGQKNMYICININAKLYASLCTVPTPNLPNHFGLALTSTEMCPFVDNLREEQVESIKSSVPAENRFAVLRCAYLRNRK